MISMAQVLEQLDLWAAVTRQRLYDAALDLCIKLSLDIPRFDSR